MLHDMPRAAMDVGYNTSQQQLASIDECKSQSDWNASHFMPTHSRCPTPTPPSPPLAEVISKNQAIGNIDKKIDKILQVLGIA
jgi:hypothetical protein